MHIYIRIYIGHKYENDPTWPLDIIVERTDVMSNLTFIVGIG
jgi:hypothetical protein